MESNKLIILDRDGVINLDSPDYIKSVDEWQAIPGSLEAIARLCREDYTVVVITNQAGIAKGLYSINTLNQIHQKMIDELHHFGGEVSAILFCPHVDEQHCDCRKPKPGLFLELAKRSNCNLKEVYALGDAVRDLQAAAEAGAKPVLVMTGKGGMTAKEIDNGKFSDSIQNAPRFRDLADFVENLLGVQAN